MWCAFRLEMEPRFDYAREGHETQLVKGRGAGFETPTLTVALCSPLPLERTGPERTGVRADFLLGTGKSITFVLDAADDGAPRAYDS